VTHLPDRAGVSVTHYFAILAGKSSPTLLWLEKIARVLKVPVRELLPPE
jgi:transcriptional regulator with XRE-family HTH domain